MRFRWLVLLASLQAWMGLVYLWVLPADPKNQALFGFSVYRLGVMLVLLTLALLSTFLFFWKKTVWPGRMEQFFNHHPAGSSRIENGLEFSALCGLAAIAAPLLKPTPEITPTHQRLLSLLVWVTLVCIEWAVLLAFETCRKEKINLSTHYISRWLGEKALSQPGAPVKPYRYRIGVVLLLLAAVLLPSNNTAWFSGLPISTWPDGFALLLVVPILLDRSFFDAWILQLKKINQYLPVLLPALLGLVIILKLVVFYANADSGFNACYRAINVTPPNNQCELSFENPTFRNQATRVDKSIFFNLDRWGLAFFNTNVFNYYGDAGNIDRKRIPFSVEWKGTTASNPGSKLLIVYTGKVQVKIGARSLSLDSAYPEVKTASMDLPSGSQDVKIDYSFDDGYHLGGPAPGPNAILRMNVYLGDTNNGPLSALPPPVWVRIFVLLSDSLFLLLLLSILAVIILRIFPAWRGLVFFFMLGFIAWWGLPELTFMAVMALAFTWLVLWRGKSNLLLAYLTLSILVVFRVMVSIPDVSYSVLRLDTTDMLTYESFARDILTSGTWMAGEPVFFYQALFRYLVFIFHLFFGESDLLRSSAVLLALNMGIFVNAQWMFKTRQGFELWKDALAWTAYLSIAALSASSVVFLIQQGISEVASWVFLAYAFYFLLLGKDKLFLAAAALIGVAVANRYNHLPALAFLYLIFAFSRWKTQKRLVLLSIIIMGLVLALLPLHNWVYGHQLVIMPTSGDATVNLILPPARLATLFTNPEVQQLVVRQVLTIFGIVSWKMLDLCVPIFIIIICWLLAGVNLVRRWKFFPWRAIWLWFFPGLFLGTQFFFYMLANYPRHMYAAYLAMALVIIYIGWYAGNAEAQGAAPLPVSASGSQD